MSGLLARMRVILVPVGSAGDINPFIVLGGELHRRGHRVTLIAPAVFETPSLNAGLDFVALGTAEDYERATQNPDLWHPRRGLPIVLEIISRQWRPGYAAIARLYEPNETMIVGATLAFFARVFEELHDVPAATVHLSPGLFRSDFKQQALPSGVDISSWPRWAKRALWWAVDRFAADPLIAPRLNRWRAELGLPPVSRIFNAWLHSPQRVLACFPDWFGEPQPDWPPQVRLTGFLLSDESCAPVARGSRLPPDARREDPGAAAELEQFLSSGTPPIAFTPGSANRHAARFFETAIEATRQIGRRALLVTAYREQLPSLLPAHVHHAAYAPFNTLFPRTAVAVHHGGIGTCAQALAAGVPQLLMPMGFDQPDNAARIARLRAGEWLAPARFTVSNVAAALTRLLSSGEITAACRRWQERMRAVDAVGLACDLVEKQYEEYVRGPLRSSSTESLGRL